MVGSISSLRSKSSFNRAWQSICSINSCESTLQECISHACFGKANCKSCVEDYKLECSKCVDEIYDETAQIQLPGLNQNTIICDSNNQMHTTVCNFFCRSSFKPFYKCELISSIPICTCMDSLTTSTKTTTPISTTPTPTTTTTKTTTTTENTLGMKYLFIN